MISLRATEKPATTSPWPLRYLVALCTTTSAPSFSGCISSGVAKAILASHHLSLPYPEQAGGVFFWVQIPDAVDAVLLWKRLRLQGVKLMPGTVFSLTGSAQHFLRLSYVGCPLEQIPEGIDTLYRLGNRLAAGAPSGVGNLDEVSYCIFCEQT